MKIKSYKYLTRKFKEISRLSNKISSIHKEIDNYLIFELGLEKWHKLTSNILYEDEILSPANNGDVIFEDKIIKIINEIIDDEK